MINVINTKVKFFRNLKDYKFVPKLDEEKRTEIENKIALVLKDKLTISPVGNLPTETVEFLKQNGLLSRNTKTVFLSTDHNVCVTLFDSEHVSINSVMAGFDAAVYTRAKEIEGLLKSKLNLSYNDEYGYLQSNLNNIGSGIRIESLIDLSSICELGKIEQVKQNLKKLGYDLSKKFGSFHTFSTGCTLGFSESEVVGDFSKMLNKVQEIEIESLKILDLNNHEEIIDKCYRSLAVLNNAYLMNVEELQKHVSNIVAGVNLKIAQIKPEIIKNLYKLAEKNKEFISKTEMIELANKTKEILKGGKDV